MKKKRNNSKAVEVKKRTSIGSPKKLPSAPKDEILTNKAITKAATVNSKLDKMNRTEMMSNVTMNSTNDRPNILDKYSKINEKMDKKNIFKNEKNKSGDFLSSLNSGQNLFDQFYIFGTSEGDISGFERVHQETKQTSFK